MVTLEKITPNNYRECLNLKVTEEQKHFVSLNVLSLAKAYVYDNVVPFAIYNDNLMVGFIMIRFKKEENYYFIWQFMIDEKHQSKGYGKNALGLVIEWAKKDGRCREIVTTYIDGNYKAKKLYESYGFQQMGECVDEEVDMILYI